jgi:hypothetical protein
VFAVNVLLCVRQLNVHVGVDADETTFVLCLTPLQPNDDLVVDPVKSVRVSMRSPFF